ncbi:thioester reductase domain-containing protein [Pseudobacteroides cellulosolvens]|uniref:Thioester reductase domain protein n=1 Tax=Pseudobacteroides cellulosolvens ATCC 35603 = DSM 2933 TaxID=398512 RepID=A0A0L6JKY1_9FIRM|nr:thioester reductase domain-containing protein [Pseudobacteroides cellulosolvens]KNY26420.1 thioester reductase domain protein [Pseudobacteroides cellulosolvens ATCC 35603 = DSM 2933]
MNISEEKYLVEDGDGLSEMQKDSILDDAIDPSKARAMLPVKEINKIFLTGATGFLGTYLLSELLNQTKADIYCLVRASDEQEGIHRLKECFEKYLTWDKAYDSRIIPVLGDLSMPLLGLSEEQFDNLSATIHAIYHSGAMVNFLYTYSHHRSANVLGTHEILKLAVRYRIKPVHYISTLYTFFYNTYKEKTLIREQEIFTRNENYGPGYAQSKLVAERLMVAARERGLPVSIYRPGRITGDVNTGACQPEDLLWRSMKACIEIQAVPDIEMLIDMAPVDYVSSAIVKISQKEDALGKNYHLGNPEFMTAAEFYKIVSTLGFSLKTMNFNQWKTALVAASKKSAQSASLIVIPFIRGGHFNNSHVLYDQTNTYQALAGTGIECPKISKELLQVYFDYFYTIGFVKKPVWDQLLPEIV